MKRSPIQLQWQLVLACAALAAVLVIAMLVLTDRLLTAHFEAAAEAQADDAAQTVSGRFARALERRVDELQQMTRSVGLAELDKTAQVRAELDRLSRMAPIYRSIGVANPAGEVLVAAGSGQPPRAVADWPVATLASTGAWLSDTRRLTAPADSPPQFGIDIGVPLHDAAGRLRGLLVAELDLGWFRVQRDEVLTHADNATLVSVAVFASDGRALINDFPKLDAAALAALAALAGGGPGASSVSGTSNAPGAGVARMRFGPDATRMLIAQSDMRPRNAASGLGWKVLVVQDLDASLQPMRRLQRLVVGWGVALALVFSVLVYLLARRVVRPYAGLLEAVTARFRADGAARTTGLTRYLDAVSAQLKEDDAPRIARGLPQARIGEQQPLEVVDMLALIAEDAAHLQQLLDLLPVGVVVFDSAQRVMYWNRQCEVIFGRSAEEVVGRAPWDGFMTELTPAEVAEMIERVNVQHKTYTVLRSHPLRDGSHRQCQWTVVPERDAAGHLVRTLALVQDVTEKRAAESSKAGSAREISALAHQLLDQEAQITSRLAQTLHDRLGQTLSALRLAFDAVDARDGDPAAWHESPMTMLIDKAVAEVREALVELRPPLLDERGLYKALDNETRSLWRNPKRVRIALTSEGNAADRHDPAEVEYAAFMVTREAIGNALRHASPHHIGVHLNGHAGGLTVEIKDDGCGFERDRVVPRPGHLGLVGMRERALAVGALVSVQSLPGVGSCVRFEWADASVQQGLGEPGEPTARDAPNVWMEDRPGDGLPIVSYLATGRAQPAANEG